MYWSNLDYLVCRIMKYMFYKFMQIYAMTACSGKVIQFTDYSFRVFYTLLEYFDWVL